MKNVFPTVHFKASPNIIHIYLHLVDEGKVFEWGRVSHGYVAPVCKYILDLPLAGTETMTYGNHHIKGNFVVTCLPQMFMIYYKAQAKVNIQKHGGVTSFKFQDMDIHGLHRPTEEFFTIWER